MRKNVFKWEINDENEELVEKEIEIKQNLRRMSYDEKNPSEIERYLDKYNEYVEVENIISKIPAEILSNDLRKQFGVNNRKITPIAAETVQIREEDESFEAELIKENEEDEFFEESYEENEEDQQL
ncbi:hypothetical protein NUSPORA_01081 [Nucleospora cyclopteri]